MAISTIKKPIFIKKRYSASVTIGAEATVEKSIESLGITLPDGYSIITAQVMSTGSGAYNVIPYFTSGSYRYVTFCNTSSSDKTITFIIDYFLN